jgi:twinkle protein
MLDEKHAEWIEARGLDVELATRLGVKSIGQRIGIPYTRKGEVAYAKAIHPTDKAATRCIPAGVPQTTLWNEDCLTEEDETRSPRDPLIITEGEWDALAVLMTGQRYVVSLPSGADDTDAGCVSKAQKSLCIEKDGKQVLKPQIAKFDRVIVMTDGDKAGLAMRDAIVDIVGANYCYAVRYPVGSKDANDVLEAGGVAFLSEIIEACEPVKSDGFVPLTAGLSEGRPKVIEIGIPALSPHLKVSRPEFLVVGGQAGHGKSTIAQMILFNLLAQNPDLKASIFHGEGHKFFVAARACKFWRYKFDANTGDPEVQDRRNRWLDSRIGFIQPPPGAHSTFEWLLWAMERHALHRRRDVLLIDPWNEILHTRDSRQTVTEYTGNAIIRLKDMAERLGLILIVVHHIAKPKDATRPPNRYDFADSAHWVNKADHAVMCWKYREAQNATRIEIVKSKDHEALGKPGHAWFSLNTERFSLEPRQAPEGYTELG